MGPSLEPDDRLPALTGWMLSPEVQGHVGGMRGLPGTPLAYESVKGGCWPTLPLRQGGLPED